MGKQQVEEEILFTYIAEARTTSIEFLNELEIHLMDHAASEALECTPDSSIHIYKIRYPDNGAASDAVPCTTLNPRSKACWMLQTKMWITTDRPDTLMSRESVLIEMEKGLNGGKLLTDTFRDLTYTKYLGPDPSETSTVDTTSPVNGSVSATGNNNALYYTLGVIGLVLASTLLLGALFVRVAKSREKQNPNLEQSDDGSIEITELLSRSRQRIKEGAAHFARREGSQVDFEEAPPHTVSENENGTLTDFETSRTKRVPAAHEHNQKSRRLTTGTLSHNSLPTSSVRSKNYQPVKQQYLKSSGSSTASKGSMSSLGGSLIENTGGSSVDQAAERRAFKGKKSARYVDTHQHRGKPGGTDLV